MKLKKAAFKNFKLLKELVIEFGDDRLKPLTVIRAENASGKTSILNGLRWGLFGSRGVERLSEVRLSPADWPDGRPCEVQVSVDFDHTAFVPLGDTVVARPTSYRLTRSITETPSRNTFERAAERIALYELSETGARPVQSVEATVDNILPPEMRDIFFTDGDAALSFISSSGNKGARRQQVKDAIRSLLGVSLVESAQKSVKSAQSAFRARVAASTGSGDLQRVERELASQAARVEDLEKKLTDSQSKARNLERLHEEAEKDLIRTLQKGNFDELTGRLEKAKKQRDHGKAVEVKLKRDHQRLFEAEALSWALLRRPLEAAGDLLAELHDRRIIPRTTIPVLQDRLELGTCICGTSLAMGTEGRAHVEQLITSQKSEDDEKQRLTRLYFEIRGGGAAAAEPGAWLADVESVERNRVEIMALHREAKNEIDWCEQQIQAIDRTEVEQKRTHRDAIKVEMRRAEQATMELQIGLDQAQDRVASLTNEFRKLSTQGKQDATARARLDVATDLAEVLQATLVAMQDTCVDKVSERMNRLFLEMIGADPEQGGLFGEAKISESFDIVVKTRDLRTLDPEFDLNGASKRALTFSFVWALTEVSGVVAPRIVDTPLGMMSGMVKSRVLELVAQPTTADPERQVVLLLTRSEIAGTEGVLDRIAGKCLTLTNTMHFPTDVRNEPPLRQPSILRCECGYRRVCSLCSRHDDATYALLGAEA